MALGDLRCHLLHLFNDAAGCIKHAAVNLIIRESPVKYTIHLT